MNSFTDKELFFITDQPIQWRFNFSSQRISGLILSSILPWDTYKVIVSLKYGLSLDLTEVYSRLATNIWLKRQMLRKKLQKMNLNSLLWESPSRLQVQIRFYQLSSVFCVAFLSVQLLLILHLLISELFSTKVLQGQQLKWKIIVFSHNNFRLLDFQEKFA